MDYATGILLALAVSTFAAATGLDKGRAFYATVAMIVATYYVLFAVMGGSTQALVVEIVVAALFLGTAAAGFRWSSWLIAACLAGHGVFDALHGRLYSNSGVPEWWPAFCAAYDVTAALLMVWLPWARAANAAPKAAATGACARAARSVCRYASVRGYVSDAALPRCR